ncbi:MAG: NAD(P)H-hydrate dehydratase [Thermodesulfobacteriota bacterium]
MFAVVGTVPDKTFPLSSGPVDLSADKLIVGELQVPVNRGTAALLASAFQVCEFFDTQPPTAYLVGDTGTGAGSRSLYAHLEEKLAGQSFTSLTFHYIQPDVDWHNRVLFAINKMAEPPVLIADAGFMYAAKMSGQAGTYEIFTPDIGELAFLADADAPHPFYTRGFIFHEPERVPELISRAYTYDNAARYLLVKGKTDIVADAAGVIGSVTEPVVPSMEAIGGTGDIITGLLAAFTGLGHDSRKACISASTVARIAGSLAAPNPGSQVMDIIKQIPMGLKQFFAKNNAN